MTLKRYFDITTDCWRFFRAYYGTPNTSDRWPEIIARAEAIQDKYDKCFYVIQLISFFVWQLEVIAMEGTK